MGLGKEEIAEVKALAIEAAERIIERVLAAHMASCPIGKTLENKIHFVTGAVAATSIISIVIGLFAYFK